MVPTAQTPERKPDWIPTPAGQTTRYHGHVVFVSHAGQCYIDGIPRDCPAGSMDSLKSFILDALDNHDIENGKA